MRFSDELRKMGVSAKQIARTTIGGRPLAEYEQSATRTPPTRYDLADQFCELWKRLGPDMPPEREYRFHATRRWRFDVAWPAQKVAVELEGGVWTRGRHTRGRGYKRDMEKYNAAVEDGWRVLRFAINDLECDPVGTVQQVAALLDVDAPDHARRSVHGQAAREEESE